LHGFTVDRSTTMTSTAKSLLVHLDGSARAEVRLTLAHQFAAACNTRVSALFAVAPRYLPLLPLAGGPPSMTMGAQVDLDHRMHAMGMFERAHAASAQPCQWLELSGEPVIESFSRRALTADLLFLGQRDPDDPEGFDVPADFVASVLIGSGRPAFVVPYAGEASIAPKSVLLAWKPTRECASAVTAALSFMKGARQVHLVAEGGDESRPSRADVRDYLGLHGISGVHEHTGLSGRHAGDDLLSRAADCGAELIVMGCYGHSRARELVLGGATRTVLDSMTVPVLMAH
jgi:nucleotide-binding universal stress UspA family protein